MTKKVVLTSTHKSYRVALDNPYTTIATGPPGTGKTYMATHHGYSKLMDKSYKKLVLARPAEGTEKGLGYEPGDMNTKLQGWMKPFSDTLVELMGKGNFLQRLDKSIELVPLHQIMGRSFNNCFIIVDEAQNMSRKTALSLVTRTGNYSKLVICGDVAQKCIKQGSGLELLLDLVEKYDLAVNTISFDMNDCLRSEECKMWIEVFDNEGLS